MTSRNKLLMSVLAASAALSINAAFAQSSTLKASDVSQLNHWYGRAGGLVGSDRITGLTKHTPGNQAVGVSFDAAVQARTNMPMDRASGSDVTVTYDEAVAARTNMPRGSESIQSAEVPAGKHN
jgi:hypothetical protein